jgi:hypothetical protein
MVRTIALIVSLMAMAGAASAKEHCKPGETNCRPHSVVKAPEIDPASAVAGLTLLLGGLAVLSARRPKARRPKDTET